MHKLLTVSNKGKGPLALYTDQYLLVVRGQGRTPGKQSSKNVKDICDIVSKQGQTCLQ